MPTETHQGEQWGPCSKVEKLFGVPRRRLVFLEDAGHVRAMKFGESQQAQKLYCFADIDGALKSLAAGKKPKIKRGKI